MSKSVWIDISIVRVWLVLTSLADEVCALVLVERSDECKLSTLEPGAVDVLDADSSTSGVLDVVPVWDFVSFLIEVCEDDRSVLLVAPVRDVFAREVVVV